MTLEAYLARFRLLQHSIEKDERSVALLSTEAYQNFLGCFCSSDNQILKDALQSEKTLRNNLAKKRRLLERYATRLIRATSLIEVPELRDYALYHYVYGLTNEQVADQSFYSVRTVYRYAVQAKRALRAAMRKVGPKAVRIPSACFRPCRPLPRTPIEPLLGV